MRKWMTILLTFVLVLGMVCTAQAKTSGKITLRTEQLTVAVGKQAQARFSLSPSSYQKAGVTYEISDETIATVSSNGKVTGVTVGECTLKIISKKDASVTAELPVSVILPVSKLTVEAEKTVISVGESTQLTCTYGPEDATLQEAVFSSGNQKVATVDENGVVTGVARGTATITATSRDGAAKASVKITVEQQPESVSLSKDELTLVTGKNTQVKATVLPKKANNTKVDWASSDEEIATVDKNGRITAHAPGQAVITASCQADPSISASLTVHCKRLAQAVEVDSKQYDIIIGETLQLQPTVLPADTTDPSVTYAVKNSKIATVDANGVVTAHKGGKTTVTITTADGSKKKTTVTIQVIVPVQGVSFAKNGVRVGASSYVTVTADVYPADATNKNMTWVSSDESIATVKGDSNKVRVYGHKWGRCLLTATSEDGGFSASIYVNVGSLRKAVVVDSISMGSHHQPYVKLRNRSNMRITAINYTVTGKDADGKEVKLGNKSAAYSGRLELNLGKGESIKLKVPVAKNMKKLEYVEFAITGWETSTGYYDNDGDKLYSYRIGSSNQEWHTYASDLYVAREKEREKEKAKQENQ